MKKLTPVFCFAALLCFGACKGAFTDPGILDQPGNENSGAIPTAPGGASFNALIGTYLHNTRHTQNSRCDVTFKETGIYYGVGIIGNFSFNYRDYEDYNSNSSGGFYGYISSYNGNTVYISDRLSFGGGTTTGIKSFRVSVSGDTITVDGLSGYDSRNFDISIFNGSYTRGNP